VQGPEDIEDDFNQKSVFTKIGIPKASASSLTETLSSEKAKEKQPGASITTSGAYFMSNELSQDLPLPDWLKLKVRATYEALGVNVFELTPTI
jgi:hypothetical protein